MMNRKVRAKVAPRRRISRSLRAAVTGAAATVALGWWAPTSAKAVSPYFSGLPANFHYGPISPLDHSFGQGPSWATTGNRVLSTQLDSAGSFQIYSSPADNDSPGNETCLTCTTIAGPNGLAQERPQGDWILFESYSQQPTHLGNPGFGGFGGDLYVMHPDGSHVYRLTTNSDPNSGVPYTTLTGTPYDNFHAYWSPHGNYIVWTHLEADGLPGGEKWEIMVGTFTVNAFGVPSLANVTVVGQPFGAYETQPWAPDGSGFIFFASGGLQSPFTTNAPGWGNARIFFMRLFSEPGDVPLPQPMVTQLTDNLPFYTEQAVFTPDMQDVIMMSNRTQNSLSWTRQVMQDAQTFAFDQDRVNTGATQTLQFVADFVGNSNSTDLFTSDLYIVDSSNLLNIQPLTGLGKVIPEFYWNADYTKLLWTLVDPTSRTNPPASTSYTAYFSGVSNTVPSSTPGWLTGTAINWGRVGAALQTPTQIGPVTNVSVPVAPPLFPAPATPHSQTNNDLQSTPAVAISYGVPWQTDLTALGNMSGHTDLASRGLTRIGTL